MRRSNDREAIVLALLVATKNAFRRLGMMLPVPAVLALLARVTGLGALVGAWGKGGTGAGPSATAEDIQVGPRSFSFPPSPYRPRCPWIASHRSVVSFGHCPTPAVGSGG